LRDHDYILMKNNILIVPLQELFLCKIIS